jgi:hypothetical protein
MPSHRRLPLPVASNWVIPLHRPRHNNHWLCRACNHCALKATTLRSSSFPRPCNGSGRHEGGARDDDRNLPPVCCLGRSCSHSCRCYSPLMQATPQGTTKASAVTASRWMRVWHRWRQRTPRSGLGGKWFWHWSEVRARWEV